jgi:pyruvate ferredoxin oxidoreductase gamma subunit
MFQVRIHGRGGQGVVTAAEILSIAAFEEGRHAQAFPSFGSERMGAPVTAFCRIDDREIRLREPVTEPDVVIVQDPTLLTGPGVFDGLPASGLLLINSTQTAEALSRSGVLGELVQRRVCAVPASELALAHLGRAIPNAALLGAFVAVTGQLTFQAMAKALRSKFAGPLAEGNVSAARAAYEMLSRTSL